IIAEVGINNIRCKSQQQTLRLIGLAEKQELRVNTPRNPEQRGGTVSIDVPEEVARELLNRDILVDWRPKAGVRMSPHFYTTAAEPQPAMDALQEILRERSVVAR